MPLPTASAGLGLRRALVGALQDVPRGAIDFIECAPENWIGVGGRLCDAFASLATRHPVTCHGLSLSLGGPAPLDNAFIDQVGAFLDRHAIAHYSEHLSWCSDDGQLYELLPLPFTDAAVEHAAARIRAVQHRLGRRIAIENVSYYATPHRALDEADFINAVLDVADCDLLLDVNNVYVNASNHGYDAPAFIAAMPTARIVHYHVAGHADGETKIDTHGAPVIDAVWALLDHAYALHGVRPTLLERDADFPSIDALLAEVQDIRDLQRRHA